MILVFGTVCIDRIRRVNQLPKPGGYVEVSDQRDLLGGEAANTACFLVMWRSEVVLAGNALGSGYEGERLRLLVLEKGLSDAYLARNGTTPVCDVFVTPDGDRTMFGCGFSAMTPATEIDFLPFESGKWFTAEPNMAVASRKAAKRAHEHGMKLYLMDFFHDDEFIPEGSVCQFSTDWVGERNNRDLNLKWVEQWTARHRCTTILSDGGSGMYVCEKGNSSVFLPVFPSPKVVDSTGAGDAFRAGILHGLSQDWSLADSLKFGAAAGSLKVSHFGATEGIPHRVEVNHHILSHPSVAEQYSF